MRGDQYIKERQRLWAIRRGLSLTHPKRARGGDPSYTLNVNDNLFEPLSAEVVTAFTSGDGGELGNRNEPGKMQALHSSSAIGCNIFHYWRSLGQFAEIAAAAGLPLPACADGIEFEAKRPVMANVNRREFPKDPNLDVLLRYKSGNGIKEAGIECKFSEAYGGYRHGGLKPAYLAHDELWRNLPHCHELAQSLCPDDTRFKYLHAAQLLKHILGLKHRCGKSQFYLLYLWYDVPGHDGALHASEIEEFCCVTRGDNIRFRAISYQELILSIAKRHQLSHQPYVDYLTERYL